MKNSILFLILFYNSFPFSSVALFAQQQNYEILKTPALNFKSNYTFILPHHKKMIHLNENHFLFYELSYSRNTNGDKYWHHLYNYPSFGLTFHYNNLGHSKILGNAYALYPYINKTFIRKKFYNINGKFGAGLAFLTNKFEKNLNPKNVAISTNLNICINFGLNFQQNITKNISLFEELGITHFSNGALKMPNTGINLPHVSLGLKYYLPAITDGVIIIHENKEIKKKHFIGIMAASGIKELYPAYGKKYPAFTFNTSLNWQRSLKQILSFNLDVFYNLANYETLIRKNIQTSKTAIIRPGIGIANEFVFDKTSFVFLVGRYLYAKDDSDGFIYNRVGFKRKIKDKIFLNLMLKSHFFVADYIEWGIGYNF